MIAVQSLAPCHRILLASSLMASAACHRYEYVPDTCPPPPLSRSAIAWQNAPGGSGTVSVTVFTIDSLRPIMDARVRLRPDSGRAIEWLKGPYTRTDVPPGHYLLDVMRIGSFRATRDLNVGPDSALNAVAVLSPQRVVLDGCGYVMFKVKKPWWKVW